MMKKLLMWSALLMTGFAFYSCDDVVDNPVQDTSAVWNYAVNVKFADFDLSPLGINPETNEPYAYEAPKTLYVFNEQLQPLGEITTEKAPAAGVSAKYTGKIGGYAIGDNLIISTKTADEYKKQDGTIKSAIENGIVQLDTVAVRVYSNYTYNLSTDDAKMKNEVGIVVYTPWHPTTVINKDFTATISAKNLKVPGSVDTSFTFNIPEDYVSYDSSIPLNYPLYLAIGTYGDKPTTYQIDFENKEGIYTYSEEFTFMDFAPATPVEKVIETGKVNWPYAPTGLQYSAVDLTKYWAAYKAENAAATYCSINTNFKGAKFYQSKPDEAVPVELNIQNDATLSRINIGGEDGNNVRVLVGTNGVLDLTLDGKNIINLEDNGGVLSVNNGRVNLIGNGSLEATGANNAVDVYGSYVDPSTSETIYTCLSVGEGVTLTAIAKQNDAIQVGVNNSLRIENNSKVTAEGPNCGLHVSNNAYLYVGKAKEGEVNLETISTNENAYWVGALVLEQNAKAEFEKGANITATGKGEGNYGFKATEANIIAKAGSSIIAYGGKNSSGIESVGTSWDIKDGTSIEDGAKITGIGGKSGIGINMYDSGTPTPGSFKVGKYATIVAQGAPHISADAKGRGMSISVTGDVTLSEGATITATGADEYGLYIANNTIDIAEKASITAIDALGNAIETDGATITGKGNLIATEAGKNAILINGGTLTLNGAKTHAKGGANKAAIKFNGGILAIGTDIIELVAESGMTTATKKFIEKADESEATKADIGTATGFNDDLGKDGENFKKARTITPKAEE